MRKKSLMLNTASSLFQQIIAIACGFVLPRYMLQYYGSEVNGLVSSVTQFLGFISFLQLGVGAVIQAAWYKPLAQGDYKKISEIYVSAQKFFRIIAIIFLGYLAVLCLVYPIKVQDRFNSIYTIGLILAIAINQFVQYYFGITNQLLLYADQKAYIYLFTQSALIITNTFFSVVLMILGSNIQIVKLGASLIFAVNPIVLNICVKKYYRIDKTIVLSSEPIEQKWNGFIQHMASVVMDNTDVMVLTIFSTLSNVSIYYVYHLVVYGIRQLINALTIGVQSLLGNMLALNEKEINASFTCVEMLFHYTVTLIYSCVTVLILPFISVYTREIVDANYNTPIFALLISVAYASYCYRLPYYSIIKAAGHFKETQVSALIEMVINLVISILLVIQFGLVGVAIGTLAANIYRTTYFVFYLKNNILYRKIQHFVKFAIVDSACIIIVLIVGKNLNISVNTYMEWLFVAFKVFAVAFTTCSAMFIVANIRILKRTIKNKRYW